MSRLMYLLANGVESNDGLLGMREGTPLVHVRTHANINVMKVNHTERHVYLTDDEISEVNPLIGTEKEGKFFTLTESVMLDFTGEDNDTVEPSMTFDASAMSVNVAIGTGERSDIKEVVETFLGQYEEVCVNPCSIPFVANLADKGIKLLQKEAVGKQTVFYPTM